jgi:putative ABC transport system permease protein
MNIFNKVTLQGMKKSRTRTIVTIIGVVLSAAMITAVATFAVSLQNYMVNGAVVKYGGWHVEFLNVDSSFVEKRSLDNGVANATAIENIGYAALEGGQNPNKPYLFITGFSEEAFDTVPITLVSGRMPGNSGEILIPAHVATNGGVKYSVGNTLSLAVGSRMDGDETLGQHTPYATGEETLVPQTEKTYTVVGIYERPAFEEYSAPGYTLITTADITNNVDSYSIFVTLTNPRQVRTYASSTTEIYSYVFNDNVLRFIGLSDDTMFNALLYSIGGILVALIMIGSVFLIYNSFNISLNERIQQFGILSSVGATAKQLRNSVLFEGLCIGAVGIPIGVLVGIGSIKLVISIVAKNFGSIAYSTVPLTLTVSVLAIVIAAVVSMVTILISAYIPARKAADTPVMECIRQTNEVKLESKAVKTSKFAEDIYGLEGTLALKNFKRNKKRYRSIVLSLTLSVVLFVSASTFGTYLKQEAERSVVDSDYDICFSTQEMDEDGVFQLYDQLKTANGVYSSSYQAIMTYSCAVKGSNFSDRYREFAGYDSPNETADLSMDIQFIEDSEFLSFIKGLGLSTEEYTRENAKMIAVAKFNDQGELSNMFADNSMAFTIFPETDDEAANQGQNIDMTFVDTIPLDTLPRESSAPESCVFMMVAPYSLKEKFEAPGEQEELGLTFLSENPAQSVNEMTTILEGAGITSQYTLYNIYETLEQNRNTLFIVNLFTVVFIIMISLIAIANVFNTISTNIRLRRRELAMLRSVGMSDRDFNKMMRFECAFYGLRTLLFGLPVAGILSWLIYKGMDIGGADLDFMFPWSSIGISVCGVFLVIFITMLYAVRKIKKENIIDALHDDIT